MSQETNKRYDHATIKLHQCFVLDEGINFLLGHLIQPLPHDSVFVLLELFHVGHLLYQGEDGNVEKITDVQDTFEITYISNPLS